MPLVWQVVADSQGRALRSRSTRITASMDIFWRSKWHLNSGKPCKTSVLHKRPPTARVIGFLSSRSPGEAAKVVAAFQDGLSESGHIVGRDVTIEFRWAEGQYNRLPALAADLVRRPVTIIAAVGGSVSAFAAKAATTALPIVFAIGDMEPVEGGLVASLNRPGGNITGVFSLNSSLGPKRLELLHEVAPKAAIIGMLVIRIIGMLRFR